MTSLLHNTENLGPHQVYDPFTARYIDSNEMVKRNGCLTHKDGSQAWFLNGDLHREDGPALIAADNSQILWYLHGQAHRIGGPAVSTVEYGDEWFQYGQRHREDGPALITPKGRQSWFIHDRRITTEVNAWIRQSGLKPWQHWGDTERILFKLRFV